MNIDEIDKLLGAYACCWNAGDLDGVMAFYAPDAVLLPHDRGPLLGHAAIRAALAHDLLSGPVDLTFDPQCCGRSDSLAYSAGRYSGVLIHRDGERVPCRGTYVMVCRRDPDGRWHTVVDAFSATGS